MTLPVYNVDPSVYVFETSFVPLRTLGPPHTLKLKFASFWKWVFWSIKYLEMIKHRNRLELVCCKKRPKNSSWPLTDLETRGPLMVLNGIILILDDHGNNLDSLRISLESFRSFVGPQTSNWSGTIFFCCFLQTGSSGNRIIAGPSVVLPYPDFG